MERPVSALWLFVHAYLHLQHTPVWIAFTGLAGRVLMSPAHHQIHHSTNPAHFNTNLGSCLSLFDWAFGTLHAPRREPEALRFGVEGEGEAPHGVKGLFVDPFLRLSGRRSSQAAVTANASRQALADS